MVPVRALQSTTSDRAGSFERYPPMPMPTAPHQAATLDAESQAWIDDLSPQSSDRATAIARLHGMLLKAARFEIRRRCAAFPHLRGGDWDDLATQSANDALIAILGKLGEFRGDSRFTTWAYKFALFEAAVNVRRRAWQGREVPLEPERWPLIADGEPTPDADAETTELSALLRGAVRDRLSPHQREVLIAVVVNGVPIDVLAERRRTTRGALYKTLHDARRKLRSALAVSGLDVDTYLKAGTP
jgi:RNA polymerase sigma-70 factor (ECF subfamily)